jgi:hypothetical protein
MNIRERISNNLVNSRGWSTKRKILVIESDDWGGIRMPSKSIFDKAKSISLPVETSPYNRFDALASSEDFEHLFAILSKHKDVYGNHPTITANVVMCNPDFERIKQSDFEEFHVEDFYETIKKQYPAQDVLANWKQGIESKLFFPQFHGREHVNAIHWLKALQAKNKVLTAAFDLGFWGLDTAAYKSDVGLNLQATYNAKETLEIDFHKTSLSDGLTRFKSYFGFSSKSFIPNNFIFDKRCFQLPGKNGYCEKYS